MGTPSKAKTRLGLLLGGLAAVFLLSLFQLSRHPETAALLTSFPGPAALICTIRCVGIAPFLQVLGEGLRALLLIVLSAFLIRALFRCLLRIFRTWSFMEKAAKKAVPRAKPSEASFLEEVTLFEEKSPLAFTAGFFKPRVFISTGLAAALEEKELRAVILHEDHHRESRDPLKGLAVSFISDFLFFLPVSRLMKNVYDLNSEMCADTHSVECLTDPLDLAASLLKVQKLSGAGASWFFDPTLERAKHILGEPAKMPLPLKKVFLTLLFLVLFGLIVLVPVRKSVSAMFIDHDKTCVLKSGTM